VSDYTELRIIYVSEREEVLGDWRRLHNEEIHKLYASPNTLRVINSGRIGWAGYVETSGSIKCGEFLG
jgi:hypothetical protein